MDLGLSGKRAVVAASTQGLGFASARALAAEGVRVAICGRSKESVDSALSGLPGDVVGLVADLTTPEDCRRFVQEAETALGGIDILVANGPGPKAGNFATTAAADYQTALEINLLSVVEMCRAAVPPMQANRWGRIVAITSLAVRQPVPNLILSNTARAGATAFLKTLAREVAGDAITVNSVQPGRHLTRRVTDIHGSSFSDFGRGIPAGVAGRPEDFGAVVTFLCSDQARYVTGVALPVDGGSHQGLL